MQSHFNEASLRSQRLRLSSGSATDWQRPQAHSILADSYEFIRQIAEANERLTPQQNRARDTECPAHCSTLSPGGSLHEDYDGAGEERGDA